MELTMAAVAALERIAALVDVGRLSLEEGDRLAAIVGVAGHLGSAAYEPGELEARRAVLAGIGVDLDLVVAEADRRSEGGRVGPA